MNRTTQERLTETSLTYMEYIRNSPEGVTLLRDVVQQVFHEYPDQAKEIHAELSYWLSNDKKN